MLDAPKPGPADLATFFAAAGAYLVFLLYGSLVRMGRGNTPLSRSNSLHLRMVWLYVLLAVLALYISGRPLSWTWLAELVIGAFFYFGLHHGIFANFFGLAQGSVSASIVSIIFANNAPTTRETIRKLYRNGEGFESLKRHRIARLDAFFGWVRRDGETYSLTRHGMWAIRATQLLLGFWGLRQLGRSHE